MSQIRSLLPTSIATIRVLGTIVSCLEYCSTSLSGHSTSLLSIVYSPHIGHSKKKKKKKVRSITSLLYQWLPFLLRIKSKFCLFDPSPTTRLRHESLCHSPLQIWQWSILGPLHLLFPLPEQCFSSTSRRSLLQSLHIREALCSPLSKNSIPYYSLIPTPCFVFFVALIMAWIGLCFYCLL